MASDNRFEWIADTMRVGPDDRVLEIGAGSSPSVAYLAARLKSGEVVAVDKSETAVTRSAKKHAALVDSGRVRLLTAALDDALPGKLGPGGFTKILAVNVNLFWTARPTAALAVVRELLAPDGSLYLVYGYGDPDGPSESPKPASAKLIGYLTEAGFTTRTVSSGDLLCVVAT
ncbi:class I SAM-dependent methyltransferase [Nocardia sp. 2]|uniref:Class I SAM-dependent methyltransferase n=1 Tax=Nocardia acididurans TaxID=2802282 RepID=A0ABS1MAJ0_9NOCA|nr:class I SAM-dependent methyltransferase [Nocardia acididurans]MBL1077632.1 class I SAM-dependent methyltransferase [Nocardia acididurans]